MDLRKQWLFKTKPFGWLVNFGRDAENRRIAWAVIWLQVSKRRLRYWYPSVTLPRWVA